MRRFFAFFLALILVILSGCGTAPDLSGMICAVILDQEHICVSNPVRWIPYGSDVTYTIEADVGYDILSADYENYDLCKANNTYTLTLCNVTVPVRVALQLQKAQAVICYRDGEQAYYENYDLTYRKRANTAFDATLFTNPGHTLVGWNTKPDLSGETVGLGSRVTVPEDTNYLELYAQWIPWNSPGDFSYFNHGTHIELTGYQGSGETVAVPGQIDGLPVTVIGSDCFTGCAAREIILPDTVRSVESGAFQNCALESLLFFDNLMEIRDDSFTDCPDFSSVHINATHLPCYANRSRHSHYADKIDLLILSESEDTPRMVFIAGSSMWFSLDGGVVDAYFEDAYTPVNVALNAFYSGTAQFEVLKDHLRPGDLVIHAPEVCSAHQLMATNEMTENMFTCFELNYDLFAGVDIRKLTRVFSAYTEYNSVRRDLPQTPYDAREGFDWMDEYGCIPFTRPATGGNEDLLDEASIGTEMLTEEAFSRLNGHYADLARITGNPVLFAFGPINYDGLPEEDRDPAVWAEFEARIRAGLSRDARVIATMEVAVLRGSNFYETDFHLNSEATVTHTQNLCDGIRSALKEVAGE